MAVLFRVKGPAGTIAVHLIEYMVPSKNMPICQGAAKASAEISVEKDVDMSKTGSLKTSCCLLMKHMWTVNRYMHG